MRRVVRVAVPVAAARGMTARPLESAQGKLVEFGLDAREQMLGGIERIAKAVSVTLGPKGRNVIIRRPGGEPQITKDGVTVARSIEFRNQFEDVGARLIRQVASKTNDMAGDGTTTATVLAWSIFAEGYKSVATGANPMDVKRGIDLATAVIRKSLREQRRTVASQEELRNVATISANGEARLGGLIADAVQTVGHDGFIEVLDGRTTTTEWYRHEGWGVETGFLDSRLLTDSSTLSCELSDCAVLASAVPLEDAALVLAALGEAAAAGRALFVAAPAVTGDALEALVLNHAKGVVRSCVLALEGDQLRDIAAATGAAVVADLERPLTAAQLGRAKHCRQTIDSTVIAGEADVETAVRLLEKKMERTPHDEERDQLQRRIAQLRGLYAVIRVGGQSAVEVSESKDRVIDALNAARAALADGIVAGGGTALMVASKKLDEMLAADEENDAMPQDQRTGVLIVRNAARLPMQTIADNAGVEGPVVVATVAEEAPDAAHGYDAQHDRYVDMFEEGIVDPVRVVDSCITDAASVAGLMITTEAAVCDDNGTTTVAPPPNLC